MTKGLLEDEDAKGLLEVEVAKELVEVEAPVRFRVNGDGGGRGPRSNDLPAGHPKTPFLYVGWRRVAGAAGAGVEDAAGAGVEDTAGAGGGDTAGAGGGDTMGAVGRDAGGLAICGTGTADRAGPEDESSAARLCCNLRAFSSGQLEGSKSPKLSHSASSPSERSLLRAADMEPGWGARAPRDGVLGLAAPSARRRRVTLLVSGGWGEVAERI